MAQNHFTDDELLTLYNGESPHLDLLTPDEQARLVSLTSEGGEGATAAMKAAQDKADSPWSTILKSAPGNALDIVKRIGGSVAGAVKGGAEMAATPIRAIADPIGTGQDIIAGANGLAHSPIVEAGKEAIAHPSEILPAFQQGAADQGTMNQMAGNLGALPILQEPVKAGRLVTRSVAAGARPFEALAKSLPAQKTVVGGTLAVPAAVVGAKLPAALAEEAAGFAAGRSMGNKGFSLPGTNAARSASTAVHEAEGMVDWAVKKYGDINHPVVKQAEDILKQAKQAAAQTTGVGKLSTKIAKGLRAPDRFMQGLMTPPPIAPPEMETIPLGKPREPIVTPPPAPIRGALTGDTMPPPPGGGPGAGPMPPPPPGGGAPPQPPPGGPVAPGGPTPPPAPPTPAAADAVVNANRANSGVLSTGSRTIPSGAPKGTEMPFRPGSNIREFDNGAAMREQSLQDNGWENFDDMLPQLKNIMKGRGVEGGTPFQSVVDLQQAAERRAANAARSAGPSKSGPSLDEELNDLRARAKANTPVRESMMKKLWGQPETPDSVMHNTLAKTPENLNDVLNQPETPDSVMSNVLAKTPENLNDQLNQPTIGPEVGTQADMKQHIENALKNPNATLTDLRREVGSDRIGKTLNPEGPDASSGAVVRIGAEDTGAGFKPENIKPSAMPDKAQQALLRDLTNPNADKFAPEKLAKIEQAQAQLHREWERNGGPADSDVARVLFKLLDGAEYLKNLRK